MVDKKGQMDQSSFGWSMGPWQSDTILSSIEFLFYMIEDLQRRRILFHRRWDQWIGTDRGVLRRFKSNQDQVDE